MKALGLPTALPLPRTIYKKPWPTWTIVSADPRLATRHGRVPLDVSGTPNLSPLTSEYEWSSSAPSRWRHRMSTPWTQWYSSLQSAYSLPRRQMSIKCSSLATCKVNAFKNISHHRQRERFYISGNHLLRAHLDGVRVRGRGRGRQCNGLWQTYENFGKSATGVGVILC